MVNSSSRRRGRTALALASAWLLGALYACSTDAPPAAHADVDASPVDDDAAVAPSPTKDASPDEDAPAALPHVDVTKIDGDAGAQRVRLEGVAAASSSASAFYDTVRNFRADVRHPLLTANAGDNRNIYSPNVVWNGGKVWNFYFHGYDGLPNGPLNDRIYFTVTADDFLTFSDHITVVDHGAFENDGNEAVVKTSDSDWEMYYTTYAGGVPIRNKPARSTSADGAHFSPNAGDASTLLSVDTWPGLGWTAADVNGGNGVLVEPNLTRHMYWNDSSAAPGLHHVTSTDGLHWSYVAPFMTADVPAVTDIRGLGTAQDELYAFAFHKNVPDLRWLRTRTASPTAIAKYEDVPLLFEHLDDDDYFMLTPGIVTNGGGGPKVANRLVGVVYGASPKSCPGLTCNAIYARWLQRHVRFVDDDGNIDVDRSLGPDAALLTFDKPRVGKFLVYAEDWDGTTGKLLGESAPTTVAPGDVFRVTLSP
jgi:hypothetical protein